MITTAERKKIVNVVLTTKDENFIRKIESLISSEPKVKRRKRKDAVKDITEFQKFLLNGPVMTDEDLRGIRARQKRLNEWR